MSRHDNERLDDIVAALDAIASHLERGPLDDDLIYDAVRVRLIEIGEAVKSIEAELLKSEPGIPWAQIAKMRDKLAHHYFDASHQIIRDTIDNDLAELREAVKRLQRNPGAERHPASSLTTTRPSRHDCSPRHMAGR